ncbi:quino protein amine dehydrogenase beta chain-like protein [Apiospora rasikravindrae]|uniref:Quino protein amine dehydrogenase beta chain-like protein n=1 Tax=Apiospora rasikravindrae TaxID=990691 RepID=A0ABR1RSI2_9PEZI
MSQRPSPSEPAAKPLLAPLDTPHVDQIDPSQPKPGPTTFPGFYNFTLEAGPEPGSWGAWSMDLNSNGAEDPAVNIPKAMSLDGMTSLPGSRGENGTNAGPKYILVGDIGQPLIYHVDTMTGTHHAAVP